MSPDQFPDLTIVLIGNTGVGKSASGNTILGERAFVSKLSMKSVTKPISKQTGNVLGKQISVVDTPGILDSEDTENEIKDFCQGLLLSSRPCLFLVVTRVGRITEEDQKAVQAAMRVLGDQGMEKSYLLFTGGDALEGGTLKDFIFEDGEEGMLPDIVKEFAGKYHLFDNGSDDEEQVRELLKKSGHLNYQETADDSRNRRIVLLGLPGAGKSSSGNTILRSEQFKPGRGFGPVRETVSESAIVEGRQVTVVDTPGISTTVQTGEQLFKEIMKAVVEASPGLHAFVIVVRIDRITETDIKLFEMLPKLFSRDAHKYSMVLFTHGDELRDRSIDGLIRSDHHVSDLVSMCGGRFCVFDNKTKRRREKVRKFLTKVDEMVSDNGGEHYTDDMFRMGQTFIKEEKNMSDSSARSAQPSVLTRLLLHFSNHKWEYFLSVVATVVAGSSLGAGAGAAVGVGVGAVAVVGKGAAAGKGAGKEQQQE